MTIQQRFLAVLIAGVVLPAVVIATLALYQFRSSILENYQSRSLSEMREIDRGFGFYLEGLASGARFLAQTDAFRNLDRSVSNYERRTNISGAPSDISAVEAEAFRLMDSFGQSREDLAYVFVGLSDGGYIQWPAGELPDNYDPRKRPWFQAGMSGNGEPVRVPAYEDANTGAPLLDYVVEFETNSGLTAVVGIDVTLKKLTDLIADVELGETGYLVLVEDTGKVLADPGTPDNNFQPVDQLDTVYSKLDGGREMATVEWSGQDWFVTQYTSPMTGWRLIGVVPADEVMGTVYQLQHFILAISALLVVFFVIVGIWISGVIAKPIKAVTLGLSEAASGEGDLTKRLPDHRKDETGHMARAFNEFANVIHDLIVAIKERSGAVAEQARTATGVSEQIESISVNQTSVMEQISTASHQMVATANEVAGNCNETAESAESCLEQVQTGTNVIRETQESVRALAAILNDTNLAMRELTEESGNITSILDTIRTIAEQTNLLALNAAIESARAGEHGRGFAVVADEVRQLAHKTANSTHEIDTLLTSLNERTQSVSSKLDSSTAYSESTVRSTETAADSFARIQEQVSRIRDMATQIATATEEQHSVAEDISQNVTSAYNEAARARDIATNANNTARALNRLSEELGDLVKQFRTRD